MNISETGRRVSELVDAIENAAPVPEDRLLDVLPSLVQCCNRPRNGRIRHCGNFIVRSTIAFSCT